MLPDSSYSQGIQDKYAFPFKKNQKEIIKNEDIYEKTSFKNSFFSRFFCFFCISKPKRSICLQKKENG